MPAVVEYLRSLLDKEGKSLSKADEAKVRETFAEATRLEKQFFDTCFISKNKDEV